MPSGLFTSCATPAAKVPAAASRSVLQQLVEHLAPLGHVVQDHLHELHLTERDQRRVDVEVTPGLRPIANLVGALAYDLLHMTQDMRNILGRSKLGQPAAHQRLVRVVRSDPIHRFRRGVGALHDPGVAARFRTSGRARG